VASQPLRSTSHPFPGARPLPEDFVEPLFPGISDAAAEIYQKLHGKTSVNFKKLPLADALKSVSETTGIPIILDLIDLENAGIRTDTPVTLQVSNVPVQTILKLLLGEWEMGYVVEDAVVIVTTVEIGSFKLTTGIFPVSDLVTEDRKSWKSLARLVEQETDGLWERIDGSGGTVSMVQAPQSLVVRQSPEGLVEVQRLLTFLRAAKRISEQRIKPPEEPKQEGLLGSDGKKKRRNKGLGGGFQGGGNFF
jgi:type II secretory pathway component GspD/PulD (secretin)